MTRRKTAGRAVPAGGAPSERQRLDGVDVAVYGNDGPTAERLAQGAVERVDTYVGAQRARASRSVDLLGTMLRHGTIDRGMANAGRRFAATFRQASFADVRALDMSRLYAAGDMSDGRALTVTDKRREVHVVITALGGHRAPAARAVWFVLGVGDSIQDWARRERFGQVRALNYHAARGILIGSLCAMQAVYEAARKCAGNKARDRGT